MIAGGIGIALLAGPAGAYFYSMGLSLSSSLTVLNTMIGVGLATSVAGAAGLLNPLPLDPSNIAPQGQLPIQTPNPLWRVVYGIFQFAGAITFADGPNLDWNGSPGGQICQNQMINRVYTLCCHQIAGFLAVVIDGQTFNFGTDIVLLTPANNSLGLYGPPGFWGFVGGGVGFNFTNPNPWIGSIFFEFDCGDPGNSTSPFPWLTAGATFFGLFGGHHFGSSRWPATALQRGRAKVHVCTHYSQQAETLTWGPVAGAPQPYVLGGGRLPIIEFKIAGRIILDYRVVTAWQPLTRYAQFNYVLAVGRSGQVCVFVQNAGGGGGAVSAGSLPNFGAVPFGGTVVDGSCVWQNAGAPVYAAGSGQTALNNSWSNKLGGPGGTILIADAWQGNQSTAWRDGTTPQIIEAPIGWLQQPNGAFVTGMSRPNFATALGAVTIDNTGAWTCLGRSKYATCLPDNDGTWNTGGFSNPALCIADYLQTPKNQFGLGAQLTLDSIDTVIAAANICDEPVVIEVF